MKHLPNSGLACASGSHIQTPSCELAAVLGIGTRTNARGGIPHDCQRSPERLYSVTATVRQDTSASSFGIGVAATLRKCVPVSSWRWSVTMVVSTAFRIDDALPVPRMI